MVAADYIKIDDLLCKEIIQQNRTVDFLHDTAASIYSRILTGVLSSEALSNSLNDSHPDYDAELDDVLDSLFMVFSLNFRTYDDAAPTLNSIVDRIYNWAEVNNVTLGDKQL